MDAESPIASSHIEHGRMPTITSSLRPPSSRCTQCNARPKENAKNGRNLIVCIDGTSNAFGQNNTNIVKLFAKIDLETTRPEQFAYYSSGIGTRPKSLHIVNRMERAVSDKFDMAVAWNMEEIVKDAYGWLARTYQEGDQIYLFGFSRGAYQVRVLAGMIHEIGLIRTPTEKQIGTAYDHYESIRSGKPKTRQIAREFKLTFSWNHTRVHFVGVWDTVSSVGLVRGDVFLSTSSAAAHACHFRHALALDELRVKFMPEYFHEMNSQTNDVRSKYIVTSDEHVTSPTSERRESTVSDGTDLSGGKKNKTSEIKEVWFAGSHSDVGGRNRPGKSHQAGNVSLLWMRREAAANGLVLQPTDIVWVPDDLDFGTSDSMTRSWWMVEYMPITHQVSFSGGAGSNKRRLHRLHPRRIIPGQKVHASILYANSYRPRASLGEGFDIPVVHTGLDTKLDSRLWETGLFDDTAAQELVAYLGGQQGVAPIYLDRLLFMLRFKEGKQCVRNVPDWHNQFLSLIHNRDCAPLVRLVTIVAYYEASCDPDAHPKSPALPHVALSKETFDDAKKSLRAILDKPKHRDGPRVVALLRPLTKHQVLRERILSPDVLETLMNLLDVIIHNTGGNFGQAMDGLTCLLQCEDTQGIMIEKLGANLPSSNITRLSRILEVKDSHLLTAALRMVMTLARIPQARDVCLRVKPRLRELAQKDKQLVGLLSVEILLALYDETEQDQLNLRNGNVRANLAGALVRLNPDRHDSADAEGRDVDPGQLVLRQLFGVDAAELTDRHRRLIGELKRAVQNGDARERTAATLTVLKLCESEIIRTFLREIDLLGTFINQLRRKDKALVAAYALATCLKYGDMKESIKDSELLPKNIVGMLRHDYFDDAVGQVEGFQIFGDFMQHADLREKIKKFDITEVLNMKLAKGTPRETRTSLICLDIFRSFDDDGPWTRELVAKSLDHLHKPDWKAQKAGVIILSALAQTEHGVAAIGPRVYEIVEMLLPEGYLPIQPTAPETSTASGTSPSEAQPQPATTLQVPVDTASPDAPDPPSRPPSWMMGPACALRILAQNEKLRQTTRNTLQYGSLKHLYLTGTLIDEMDTRAWHVCTPNRGDVIDVLDKMIKSVDEEMSEEGLMSIGDAVLPHIKHWDRLGDLVRDQTVTAITILPALLGVSVLAVLAVAVVAPVYLSVRVITLLKKLMVHYQDSQILEKLRNIPGALLHEHEGESGSGRAAGEHGGEGGEGSSAPHDGERSQGSQILERLRGHLPGADRPVREGETDSGGATGEHDGEGGGGGSGPRDGDGERSQILEKPRGVHLPEAGQTAREGESDSGGATGEHNGEGGEGGSGPHDGERSQGRVRLPNMVEMWKKRSSRRAND